MARFSKQSPPQKFQRFQQVRLEGSDQRRSQFEGSMGTVVWADPPQSTNEQWNCWSYCVHLPSQGRYVGVLKSNLRATGQFSAEADYLGTAFELSHDLLPDEHGNFSFVEGAYRVPGKFWQVMVFCEWDVPTVRHRAMTWDSGITGTVFDVPPGTRLTKPFVERAMCAAFGVERWIEVQGPDSMILR